MNLFLKKKLFVFDSVKTDPRLWYLWKYFIVHSNKLTILLRVPLNQSWELEHQMSRWSLLSIIVNFLESIMCVSIELLNGVG